VAFSARVLDLDEDDTICPGCGQEID